MNLRLALVLFAGFALACTTSHVPRSSSRMELQRYVNEAARVVSQRGKAACPLFDQPQWKTGEYYVFVTEAETHITVCHPVSPELIGQNQEDLQDKAGKYFIREMFAVSSGPGQSGWVEYLWPRPGESAPSLKTAYVVGVTAPDGKRYVVGSGAYVSHR